MVLRTAPPRGPHLVTHAQNHITGHKTQSATRIPMMMNAATRIIIGPKDRNFFDGERFLIKARDFKNATGLSEGLSLKFSQIITVSSSVFLVFV